MEDKALALFAGKPRIQRDERQLTEAFARMCEGDDALRIGFVRAVLAAVGTRRARSAARHLPSKGTALVIEPEKSLGPKKKGWFKNSGGRPDLIVSGGGTTIIVEAKVGAGLGDKQLQCYVEHGSVVLVTEKLEKIPMTVRARPSWLGQTTWRPLIRELEKVEAGSATKQKQWLDLLEIIQVDGDLGDGVATWDRGKRRVGTRNRLILQSVKSSAPDYLADSLSKNLNLKPGAKCTCKVNNSRADRVTMDLNLPPNSRTPTLRVEVWGKRRPLRVAVHVPTIKTPPGQGAKRPSVEANLSKAGFKKRQGVFSASTTFGPKVAGEETPPQVALREALFPLLKAVAESGALDGYVNGVSQQVKKRLTSGGARKKV